MSIVVLTDIIAILLTLDLCSAVKNDIGPIASKLAHFLFSVDPWKLVDRAAKNVSPLLVFNLGG